MAQFDRMLGGSFRLLPRGLQVLIALSTGGMLVIGIIIDLVGAELATAFPELLAYLSNVTPSVVRLNQHLADVAYADQLLTPQVNTAIAHAVMVLYGMLTWGAACIASLTVWSSVTTPRIIYARFGEMADRCTRHLSFSSWRGSRLCRLLSASLRQPFDTRRRLGPYAVLVGSHAHTIRSLDGWDNGSCPLSRRDSEIKATS